MKLVSLKWQATFVMLAFVFSSCSQKYTLEYNLTEGESMKQNFDMEMSVSQNMMGQDMTFETTMSMGMDYHVDRVVDDLVTMTFVFDTFGMEMDMGGATISVSSETSDSIATMQNMGPLFKAIIGLPITMVVDKKGNVEEIKGFENYSSAMLNALDVNIDEKIREQLVMQFGKQFSSESLKSSYSTTTVFPDKPVAIGDTWQTTVKTNNGDMEISIEMTNKLVSVVDNIATIESKGDFELTEPMVQNLNGMEATIVMSGTQAGFLKLDINTGWTLEGEITQDFNIETEFNGMSMPQKISSKIIISN